jgi:hypothetical protein
MNPLFFLLVTLAVGIAEKGGPVGQKMNGKAQGGEEQALIVWIRLGDDRSGTPKERENIFKLEGELRQAIEKSGAGEYDGNEIGGGFFTLYMYGSSASRLWETAAPVLKRFHSPTGSYAIKRYGKPGAKEDRVALSN